MEKNEQKLTAQILTPELADKIFDSVQMKRLGDKLCKEYVLHHLKQLKAEFGKIAKNAPTQFYRDAVLRCMESIDNKIGKVNKIK